MLKGYQWRKKKLKIKKNCEYFKFQNYECKSADYSPNYKFSTCKIQRILSLNGYRHEIIFVADIFSIFYLSILPGENVRHSF